MLVFSVAIIQKIRELIYFLDSFFDNIYLYSKNRGVLSSFIFESFISFKYSKLSIKI